jgi:hypothetical protein
VGTNRNSKAIYLFVQFLKKVVCQKLLMEKKLLIAGTTQTGGIKCKA